MSQYAYAICDGDELSVLDFRVHVFWHKDQAKIFCPKGHTVRRVKIEVPKSKGGQS
jgi:hypothetical protein